MKTKYVSAEELLMLHAYVIDQTGGSHGVRDVGLLTSLLEKPKAVFGGGELYPDLITKTVAFTEAIVNYHVFVDGNKRTAFIAMMRFLYLNGYTLTAEMKDIENTMVAIADKSMNERSFGTWIEKHISLLLNK